jgi:hypothetical protein
MGRTEQEGRMKRGVKELKTYHITESGEHR